MIPGRQLTLANFWVAVIAFGLGAAMAVMQALARADAELPMGSPSLYYLSVTAHGVLMALVFTTFFIMALGYFCVGATLGRLETSLWGWVSYIVAHDEILVGTNANVLVVPGYVSELVTLFPKAGEYLIVCNEYCGLSHHLMQATLIVEEAP